MIISEIFGPTIQGEGSSLGRRCGFVRLGKCNLTCSWCDTPYTWDWQGRNGTAYSPSAELSEQSVTEVLSAIKTMNVPLVVITGGEPLLQRSELTELAAKAKAAGIAVEIETNGTLAPWSGLTKSVQQYNVSIKLANSGVAETKRVSANAIGAFAATNSIFKFVADTTDDLDEIATIVDHFDLNENNVWVMPEGTTAHVLTAKAQYLAPAVIQRGWNMTTRLHVLLWGSERGV